MKPQVDSEVPREREQCPRSSYTRRRAPLRRRPSFTTPAEDCLDSVKVERGLRIPMTRPGRPNRTRPATDVTVCVVHPLAHCRTGRGRPASIWQAHHVPVEHQKAAAISTGSWISRSVSPCARARSPRGPDVLAAFLHFPRDDQQRLQFHRDRRWPGLGPHRVDTRSPPQWGRRRPMAAWRSGSRCGPTRRPRFICGSSPRERVGHVGHLSSSRSGWAVSGRRQPRDTRSPSGRAYAALVVL